MTDDGNVIDLNADQAEKPARRRRYTKAQIELALTCVVGCGGSIARAQELLAQRNLKIDDRTLRRWRDSQHADLYADIARRLGPDLEAHLIREFRALATMAVGVQRQALEQVEGKLVASAKASASGSLDPRVRRDILDPDELTKIVNSISKMTGQNVDRLLVMTGRPTEIVEERTLAEIVRGLQARKVLAVESTAEEITDGGENPAKAGK